MVQCMVFFFFMFAVDVVWLVPIAWSAVLRLPTADFVPTPL